MMMEYQYLKENPSNYLFLLITSMLLPIIHMCNVVKLYLAFYHFFSSEIGIALALGPVLLDLNTNPKQSHIIGGYYYYWLF